MPRALLFMLLLLFVGSGCAALLYEVIWFQLLQLVIGSSAISLAVLLATYMGGMCLGSLLLPRFVPARIHPLRLYGWIEMGIGIFGLLVLLLVPALDQVYAAIAGGGILLRCLAAALCLLGPTLLMGASLPAIGRFIEATPTGVSWMGYFYGGNIAGAVVGAVLGGFYILRLYDMRLGTYAAAAINYMVAITAFALARRSSYQPAAASSTKTFRGSSVIYLAIALSGLSALGAEVVWTRLLAMMLGATVYTFSIILAVFLTGLGLGSAVGSLLAKRGPGHARFLLGLSQFALVVTIAWAAYTISTLIPTPTFDPTAPLNPLEVFRMDLARCIWAILPAALLWGASFPLALAAMAPDEGDSALLTGRTYAANTLGGIIGALLFSLLVIPRVGTQNAERCLIAAAALAAIFTLGKWVNIAVVVAAFFAMASVPQVPWVALAYGRGAVAYAHNPGQMLYLGEGMNSTVVVSQPENGTRYFHVSGKVEATTEPFDMRLQRMLGHLSALLYSSTSGNREPRSVLVVGFGAGVTAGTFTLHPGIDNITIVEIEPIIPPASTRYFAHENYSVLHDPRTRIYYDDARHFILTSKEKFDIITSDPIHPWVKGTASLYSKEYFELCKQHLKPGGVVTQWVPLYESDFATVKSEFATFFSVFPHGTVWNSDASNKGYDVVVAGQVEPASIDVDAMDRRMRSGAVFGSLREVGLGSAVDLLSTYAGRGDDLKEWLRGAQINRDLNMRLQYLAGWGLNLNHPDLIYRSLLRNRTFPKDLFAGSPALVQAVRDRINGQ